MAVAIIGGAAGFVLSALVGNSIAAVATPASSQLLGRWSIGRIHHRILGHADCHSGGHFARRLRVQALAQSMGWRGTMLISTAACWCFALLLQTTA